MIKIVAVGKIKEKALRTQIEEYEKRLRPFTKLEIIEVMMKWHRRATAIHRTIRLRKRKENAFLPK